MSIFKYVSFDVLDYILDGTIRFTQPSAFNDPFEMLPELYIDEDMRSGQIKCDLDILSQARIPNPARLSPSFRDEHCHDFIARCLIKHLNEKIGISCFSKNSNNLLMWAHYADQYKGAVIEFDESHDFFLIYIKFFMKKTGQNLISENY